MTARVRIVRDQLKVASIDSEEGSRFEFFCDEPHTMGGSDSAPQPLSYVAAGVGFCLLTQVTRYAAMLKKTIDRAECVVEFDWYLHGSVLGGTVEAGASACRTRVALDSPESDEDVLRIVRLAKRGCYAEGMVQQAVPVRSTYILNGVEQELSVG